jgi:ABC-type multidrug transport system fused ATPase/permease subunit
VHIVGSGSRLSASEGQESPSTGPSLEKTSNANIFEDLSFPLSDGELNISQGQRQLLCLTRAILQKSKVIVIDEATSAVDMNTDALIQLSIREHFAGSTLLVMAHRLSTITDFDKIAVLSDGIVKEFGSPKELLVQKGIFWDMVAQNRDVK